MTSDSRGAAAALRVAVLAPISWRVPPRHYGPWEQFVSLLTEGLVERGLDVTLFATADSITKARLVGSAPHGYSEDPDLDAKVWEKVAPIQAHRVKQTLGLGDDVQALAAVLKFTAPQWAPAGFEWEFDEVGERELRMTVHECPMGRFRKGKGLELLPCKYGSPLLYTALAKVVNERFETTCLHAHPDPPKEGVMCQWKFVLKD